MELNNVDTKKTKCETGKLFGVALDWAVAKCERNTAGLDLGSWKRWARFRTRYTEDEVKVGMIIIQRRIYAMFSPDEALYGPDGWVATTKDGGKVVTARGPTKPVAALRCYVKTTLGEYATIPDDVLHYYDDIDLDSLI